MSTIIASNVSDGTLSIPTTYVTNGSAKAWVNFNGTGTVSIRDSFNVSSLTDNGTGDYTTNWVSAFNSGNYAISGAVTGAGLVGSGVNATFASPHNVAPTASALRSVTYAASTASVFDSAQLTLSIHGDLA